MPLAGQDREVGIPCIYRCNKPRTVDRGEELAAITPGHYCDCGHPHARQQSHGCQHPWPAKSRLCAVADPHSSRPRHIPASDVLFFDRTLASRGCLAYKALTYFCSQVRETPVTRQMARKDSRSCKSRSIEALVSSVTARHWESPTNWRPHALHLYFGFPL